MQVYLVGGAVRDALLGKQVLDRDWVVVGATAEEMIAAGYQQVGKDFPVFLHPKTKEEYALARTEQKVGPGYGGFHFTANAQVSLAEDLSRRDLTINAIAQDAAGVLIDPYNGVRDIENSTLRHVSDAFVEDPVRLLRVARFAATLPDFSVHPETMALLQQIVRDGELTHLTIERVWRELHKALMQPSAWRFFDIITQCNAHDVLWPGCFSIDRISVLQHSKQAISAPEARFASLFAHEPLSELQAFCKRYQPPKSFVELAKMVCVHGEKAAMLTASSSADEIVSCLEQWDVWRKPARFGQFCQVLAWVYPSVDTHMITDAAAQLASVRFSDVPGIQDKQGVAIQQALHDYRVAVLDAHRSGSVE